MPQNRIRHHFETRLCPSWREPVVFRAQVADFYRTKGYQVRENPRVRGASESIYAVEMVAEGPLGALLISFGDAGGVDAAEISRVRTLARDIGATPVIAATEIPPDLRRMAAQFAVVVLDGAALMQPDEAVPTVPMAHELRRDLDAHPWPASGRARPEEEGGAMDPQDVDDLLSQLGSSRPAARPRSDPAGLWKRTSLAPPVPAANPRPAQPISAGLARPMAASPGAPSSAGTARFGWLTQPGSGVAQVEPARPTLDDVLPPLEPAGAPPQEPLVSHDATVLARRATLVERAEDLRDNLDERVGDRAGLIKFGLLALGAALLLFLGIRYLT